MIRTRTITSIERCADPEGYIVTVRVREAPSAFAHYFGARASVYERVFHTVLGHTWYRYPNFIRERDADDLEDIFHASLSQQT